MTFTGPETVLLVGCAGAVALELLLVVLAIAMVVYGDRHAADPLPPSLDDELAGPFTRVRVVETPSRRDQCR